ncbi:MAG: glycosyltransferase family 2 protein [Parcubacteria group bacterium]
MTDYRKYRLLEMVPGLMVWTTFAVTTGLSLIRPIWAIYFIIVFDLYWLVRISYMMVYVYLGYRRFRIESSIDWLERCKSLSDWNSMHHLIFVPTYKEPYEVLHDTFTGLVKSSFPSDRFIVVLAGEEKDKEQFLIVAQKLQSEFEKVFSAFLVTVHPSDIPGDVPGKGSNSAWAAKEAKKYIDTHGIRYDKVIVSSFDADTVVHSQYFSYLTYRYLTHPNPTHASFQPVPLFNNNVWETHAFSRVVSYSTTFWLMSEQLRPERMYTFSSHSMSFQALVDVGFWQRDIVTEDSRIGLQGLMHYDGDYRIEPLYIPLSMDIVSGKTFWQTVKSQYKQQRRWAYGVENFPWMIWNFGINDRMPFIVKFRYVFNQLEGVYSWATTPIVIFIVGRLPLWIAQQQKNVDAIAQNAPNILSWLMSAAMLGIFLSAILGATLLPPKPPQASKWRYCIMIFQWALLPVTLILFGSIPATDAVTRLMLGKYLGFDVTRKLRKRIISSDEAV